MSSKAVAVDVPGFDSFDYLTPDEGLSQGLSPGASPWNAPDFVPPRKQAPESVSADALRKTAGSDAQGGELGTLVVVPLGSRLTVGVVLGDGVGDSDPAKLRPIERMAPEITAFGPYDLAFAQFAASYYQRGLGECLLGSLPRWLREPKNLTPAARGKKLIPAQQLQARPFKSKRLNDGEPSGDGEPTPVASTLHQPPALTDEQLKVLADIPAADQGFAVHLLHGVTGSGKTEVYLQLIQRTLDADPAAQVLVMTPEIGLTPQLLARVEQRFPRDEIVVLHSNVADRERAHGWLRAASGQARIVVGTRLSVFVPIPNLRMMLIDEEHDASFKQQEGLRYHARDLAIWRARQREVPIVLGSATPSLESWRHAMSGRYRMHKLTQRAHAHARLPVVRIIPTAGRLRPGGISKQLDDALRQRIAAQELSLVFHNRRGYAPVLSCPSCGWVSACDQCTASPVLHRVPGRPWRMICHHCGSPQRVPKACPECGDIDLAPLGSGTQRLEDELTQRFPNARVLRLDRDSVGQGERAAFELAAANTGNVDIIVGTQMLAKGHDLSRATLVAIVDPDAALFSHDFRAPEHLFSLLLQVAGRAGRADRAGEVIIQTRYPEHMIFGHLLAHDYTGLANRLLRERRELGLPPFGFQAVLRVQMASLDDALAFLAKHQQPFAQRDDVIFHPPLPMSPECIGRKWRAQLLIESGSRQVLHAALRQLRDSLPARTPRCDWHLDVDPLMV